jgi:hypothetical protein
MGALVSLTLATGGILLVALQRVSGLRETWGAIDESLSPSWLLPTTLPTLVFPVIALLQSRPLARLWRDVFATIDRFGGAQHLMKSDPTGLLLPPAAAILFMPLLEAAAGFFLVAAPPLLLALLWVRSRRFKLESRRLLVLQWSLVAASVLGAMLFGQLVDLAAPHIRAAGPESVEILAALTRGRHVLTGTATAYAAIVLVNALGLWLLMNASRTPAAEVSSATPTAPVQAETEPVTPAPSPPSPQETLEDVLARYRARHPKNS